MQIRNPLVGVDAHIDPNDARPFLRYVAANPRLPNGRTEASAPTGRFTILPMGFAILQLCSAGSMRRPQASFEAQPRAARLLAPKMGIDPYGILRCRRTLYDFAAASCAGGVEPLPYGSIGNTGKTHTSGRGETTSKEGCSNEHPSFGTGDGNTPAALPPPCHPDFLLALLAQRAPLAAVQNPGGRTTVSLRRPRHQKAGRSRERPAFWYRRRESNPYGAMPGDFKSPVSTCSTTPAYLCILPFLAACVKWRTEKTPAVLFGRRADFQIAQALR